MLSKSKSDSGETVIMEVSRGTIEFCILGTRPLILNRMSQKVWHELLAPAGRKTAADKASTMKHNPIEEYRASAGQISDPRAPTLLCMLPTAFKRAMGSAALDMPGANKSQIGRLVYVEGEQLPIYGLPQVFMAITRSSDINRTPDVRTRAILPEWACRLKITFTTPILREQSIINLLAAAGFQSGVGDWRQEKGSGSYGSFKLVSADDPDFVRIVKTQGRAAQQGGLDFPSAYNAETEELLGWFDTEVKRRGFKAKADAPAEAPAKVAKAEKAAKAPKAISAKSKGNGATKTGMRP
jgi:hypothetical protein